MATRSRIEEEFNYLSQNPVDFCSAGPIDDDMFQWQATIIGPPNSPYEGGLFVMFLQFSQEYPYIPPKVIVGTKIYHPNLQIDGNINLEELWTPSIRMSKVLLSIWSVLAQPNSDNHTVPEVHEVYKDDKVAYEAMARYWTQEYAMG